MSPVLRQLLVLAVLWAGGQPGGAAAAGAQSEVAGEPTDALRCWRRVAAGFVRVGEHFTMTLTCRVVETDRARAVPDLAGLEPETLDAPPFDVLRGERFADVRAGAERLFQYHYTLRLGGEDHFGADVEIPPLELNYRIERQLEDGTLLPGRELTYVLPAESIRVVSLVPEDGGAIRGLEPGTLGAAEARGFRARLALLVAAGLGIVALGLLALGVRRARRERRGAAARAARPAPAAAVAWAVTGELTALRELSLTAGWTPAAIQRALTALRLAAAVALGRPLAERAGGADGEPLAGELRIRTGLLRARSVVVSSAVTPGLLANAAARGGAATAAAACSDGDLERLRDALAAFSAARYARGGEPDGDLLAAELDSGLAATRPLRVRTLAAVRRVEQAAAAVRDWWRSWTR